MRIRTGLGLGLLLVVLAAAGCGTPDESDDIATAGGATPSATPGATPSESIQDTMLRYAQCMRSNGVPEFPDPQIDGDAVRMNLPPGLDRAKVDAAQAKCKQYMPNGGEPPKADPEMQERLLRYAQCMREHGVPKFPDPSGAGFQIDMNALGMGPDDPTFKAAEEACTSLRPTPPGGGGPRTETNG